MASRETRAEANTDSVETPGLRLRKSDMPKVALDVESLVRSREDEEEKREPPYRVLLHNDDVTPIDYVPGLLRRVFRIGRARAVWLTLRAHVQGCVIVVVEPRPRAERHVSEAHEAARHDGHVHLTLSVEPAES